ncbi:hypothetical protein SUGI_1184250 [Cryptomeria japonica]|nr:hypothetical protein SUGI_1184250 [Cryptomeria japonica]
MQKPHVVAVPFPALGQFIPFLHLAKLLSSHGIAVSYVTTPGLTPGNVSRLQSLLVQRLNDGLDVRLVVLPTPAVEGLQGQESTDLLSPESDDLIFELAESLQHPFKHLDGAAIPPTNSSTSSVYHPRYVHGLGCRHSPKI